MKEIIISENIGKKYLVSHDYRHQHDTIRDKFTYSVKNAVKRLVHPFTRSGQPISSYHDVEDFWALKDISFAVKEGEKLGIIGRNGAGKSTLLKILSRITEPTQGRVAIRGRVASLLEVGTGFHPELTGKENIYLNGSILGMKKSEIDRKFDEIVDFSGVEQFLDTPVKRYSSGMRVRLAFSVAAHLEPEILLIDEVLAVGDIEFQKRCIGKMEDVSKSGRTIIFVSHSMDYIRKLCKKTILLENGTIAEYGDSSKVIEKYLNDMMYNHNNSLADIKDRKGDQRFIVSDLWLSDEKGEKIDYIVTGQFLNLNIGIKANNPGSKPISGVCNIAVRNMMGETIFDLSCLSLGENISLCEGKVITYSIPKFPLLGGSYILGVFLAEGTNATNYQIIDWIKYAKKITVVGGDYHGFGYIADKRFSGLFDFEYYLDIN